MESTYGGRFHEAPSRDDETFCRAIKEALELGGRVYIPAFAVERTQQLLYLLNRAYHEGTLPLLPVYVDSPMAVGATEISAFIRSVSIRRFMISCSGRRIRFVLNSCV